MVMNFLSVRYCAENLYGNGVLHQCQSCIDILEWIVNTDRLHGISMNSYLASYEQLDH